MTDSADPVFVLAAPRSMSSVGCAMLGSHPEMYGLPETHLFREDTVAAWLETSSAETFHMADGLLRAVAEICYGDQTASTVVSAWGWLRRRATYTSGMVFEELGSTVAPLRLVDKSPNMVYLLANMQRVLGFFPQARFVHLIRHPRAYSASVVTYLKTLRQTTLDGDGARAPQWIENLAFSPFHLGGPVPEVGRELDPQVSWYALNSNVVRFLDSLADDQWVRVRAEDLIRDPTGSMTALASRLGLRADVDSVAPTLHPELSPFACLGPPGAQLGNDLFFLQRPGLRPARAGQQNLDDPLEWRADGHGFLPEVAQLAHAFGYR